MAKSKRNIGLEILEGLREIKRGEYSRVINVPDVATIQNRAFSGEICSTARCLGPYAARLGAGSSSSLWRRKNSTYRC